MTKKMECIKNLKNKLYEMQRQLQRIQSNKSFALDRSLNKSISPDKPDFNKTQPLSFSSVPIDAAIPRNPSWKSPTFWGANPITGKQNYASTPSKWVKNKSPRSSKIQLSPKLAEIKNFMDTQYYDHSRVEERPKKPRIIQKSAQKPAQRFQYSFHGQGQRETPRFQKIKTFDHQVRNPILDPQKFEEKGKKIVKKLTPTPLINLVENPKSNPLIYYRGDKMLTLSPKAHNNRNLSPYLKEVMSSSIEEKLRSPKRKSCKKHFTKYFQQNLQSRWA